MKNIFNISFLRNVLVSSALVLGIVGFQSCNKSDFDPGEKNLVIGKWSNEVGLAELSKEDLKKILPNTSDSLYNDIITIYDNLHYEIRYEINSNNTYASELVFDSTSLALFCEILGATAGATITVNEFLDVFDTTASETLGNNVIYYIRGNDGNWAEVSTNNYTFVRDDSIILYSAELVSRNNLVFSNMSEKKTNADGSDEVYETVKGIEDLLTVLYRE